MKIHFATLGCRLNEAELATWSRQFASRGHATVASAQEADVVVVNSCAVTAEAARKSRKLVSQMHRKSPEAKLVLTGCYAELEREKAQALAGVDLVVSNTDKDRFCELLTESIDEFSMPARAMDSHVQDAATSPLFLSTPTHTRSFIKVQDGCRNRCTFCIVTIARGKERSRNISDIISEIQMLSEQGVNEVVLTGVHLGGYGSDIGHDLSELTRAVLKDTDVPRVRLSSLEPWDLPPGFSRLWEHPRLMPHLHLPLQSGSDSVLKRMARRCFRKDYRKLNDELRAGIDGLNLSTDLIVGFPGETESEWRESVDFVREIGFGHMHIFQYSSREGTTAARMPSHVDTHTKKSRSKEMHQLAALMKRQFLASQSGLTRSVLWERGASESCAGMRSYYGYTDNYLRVRCEVPGTVDLVNVECPSQLSGDQVEPGVLAATPQIDLSGLPQRSQLSTSSQSLRLPVL